MNEIDDLLERIETPLVDVGDDVARGDRALRRRRGWQVGGTAVSAAAVVALVAALQGGNGSPGASAPGFADRSTVTTHESTKPQAQKTHDPRVGPPPARIQRLKDRTRAQLYAPGTDATLVTYHHVLAEHLDPTGTKLRLAENEQGGGGSFGTKLDWNHGGMLEIVVGTRWSDAMGFYLLENAGMQPTTYDGDEARVSTIGDDLAVSVKHDDGTVVTLIASASFGNNGTSTPSLGLTQHQLLGAAADPRIQLPPYLR